jgi:hypothetical protein
MKSFENELRSALARRNPPEGFSDRVMSEAGRRRSYPSYLPWLAAAAVLILMLAGVIGRERRQRMEAEAAGEQLVRAIEIVDAKLAGARHRVMQMGETEWDIERKSQQP